MWRVSAVVAAQHSTRMFWVAAQFETHECDVTYRPALKVKLPAAFDAWISRMCLCTLFEFAIGRLKKPPLLPLGALGGVGDSAIVVEGAVRDKGRTTPSDRNCSPQRRGCAQKQLNNLRFYSVRTTHMPVYPLGRHVQVESQVFLELSKSSSSVIHFLPAGKKLQLPNPIRTLTFSREIT